MGWVRLWCKWLSESVSAQRSQVNTHHQVSGARTHNQLLVCKHTTATITPTQRYTTHTQPTHTDLLQQHHHEPEAAHTVALNSKQQQTNKEVHALKADRVGRRVGGWRGTQHSTAHH